MKRKNVKVFLLSVMLATTLSSCLDFWHPLEEGKEESQLSAA
jgi:hypothetical protein